MTNNEHFFLFRYRIFLRFVLNHIVFGDEYKTTRQDIYDAYMEYCKDCKELIMCKNTFFSNFKRDIKSLSNFDFYCDDKKRKVGEVGTYSGIGVIYPKLSAEKVYQNRFTRISPNLTVDGVITDPEFNNRYIKQIVESINNKYTIRVYQLYDRSSYNSTIQILLSYKDQNKISIIIGAENRELLYEILYYRHEDMYLRMLNRFKSGNEMMFKDAHIYRANCNNLKTLLELINKNPDDNNLYNIAPLGYKPYDNIYENIKLIGIL